MLILLGFAFFSGLITIATPCIWPLLPIVLSASSTGGHRKPLGITLGIIISFAFFTLTLSYIVKIIPFDPNVLRLFAVVVIGFLGMTLLIPHLSQIVEGFVSRLSGKIALKPTDQKSGFWGGFVLGISLGLVWSPCAGPILATIATLAATRAVSFEIVLVTAVYVTGVGIPLFLFATVGKNLFSKSKRLSPYTGRIQQLFGVIMIITAILIYTNIDKTLQVKLLDLFPSYSNALNAIESGDAISNQLQDLKKVKSVNLSEKGTAPEFVGISKWLNTDAPLTMEQLRGKVVLVDFWTYTCINCIRTLPFVTGWYEKYKDKGFIVIGVHTPEFEFEKKTENVEGALKQYNIHYPVVQDNDYETWRAYDNHYWPAKYLIDKNGVIRRTHFGEGEYDETERAIQELLKEGGQQVSSDILNQTDQTPLGQQSPETYLGLARLGRFESNEIPKMGMQLFTLPTSLNKNAFAYEGEWTMEDERAIAGKNAVLEYNFLAQKVFLVMSPESDTDVVKVYLDGKPIPNSLAGADVKDGRVVFTMDNAQRLYHLVSLDQKESHILRIEFVNGGVALFAFTFG